METVRLKNKTEEVEGLVAITMMTLGRLIEESPIVFYELVMKCRDRGHVFWGDAAKVLRDYNLIEYDGDVHQSLRNIVTSAVVGDGLDMRLVSPLE